MALYGIYNIGKTLWNLCLYILLLFFVYYSALPQSKDSYFHVMLPLTSSFCFSKVISISQLKKLCNELKTNYESGF